MLCRELVAVDSLNNDAITPLVICVPLPGVCPWMKVRATDVLWTSVSESQTSDPWTSIVIGPMKLPLASKILRGLAFPMKKSFDGTAIPAKLRNWSTVGLLTLRIVEADCPGRNCGKLPPDVRVV